MSASNLPVTVGPFVVSQDDIGNLIVTVNKPDNSKLVDVTINPNGGVRVGNPNI